jgi:hypothetical protein
MKNWIKSLLCLTSALLSCEIFAQEANGPAFFRILNIRAQGDGCPPGTTVVNIAGDQQAYTVSFSAFVAEVNGATPTDLRKACRLVFDTEHEPGWEYAVVGVILRGAAFLDPEVQAKLGVKFGGGRSREGQSNMRLQGPLEMDYVHTEDTEFGQGKWSGCKGGENKTKDYVIGTSLQLSTTTPGAQGLMTLDTVDGQVKQVYDLAWRRCDGKGPKHLAVCSIRDASRAGRGLAVRAQGRKPELALTKAREKLSRRCLELGKGLNRCDVSQASCEVRAL